MIFHRDIPQVSPVPSRPTDDVSILQLLFSFKGRINKGFSQKNRTDNY